MKKMTNPAMLLFLLTSGLCANAQTTKHLSIEEAISLGIQNSNSLKIDQAKIEQATAGYIEAKNRQLPELKLTGMAAALTNAKVDMKMAQQGSDPSSFPIPHSAYLGSANLSYPVYTGGKISYGIQSATYLQQAAKLQLENNKSAVSYNISQAYNNLYKASQAIKLLEENLKAAQERDKQFLRLESNGIIPKNDRLKASLQTSELELQLLDAKNNYKIASINMDLLIGLPDSTQLEVDDAYVKDNNTLNSLGYYLDNAKTLRKDLEALSLKRKAAEMGTKSAKAEHLPTVALTGGYIAADLPKVISMYNVANIGVGINYNLDNLWKKNSALTKAKANEMELEATNDMLNDQITLEVNRDYQNVVLANNRIEVLERAVEQANENYRITKNKFNNGLATMTELLDADAIQIATNINVTNAKADAALANKKLKQTAGLL
ncbi:TolC family protein [Polluticaenibacter yanchengensis]|uniref:TolC family protein n=1 Tax=Polluticaenibacter yanchengensis TaxID=3014562 RepID=A0ABT4UP98_9BACT|nr:TolC family protein [Chitinophagaceae bacterium LY-5]